MAFFVELQTPLPGVPETIGPFAGVAISFVPDELFRPKPALFPERQDQLQHVDVAFSVFGLLFNVQNECSSRFKDAAKLRAALQKPRCVQVGLDAPVCLGALIRVRRGCDDKVKGFVLEAPQGFEAVTVDNISRHAWIFAAIRRGRQRK